jgi:hypothetical protein
VGLGKVEVGAVVEDWVGEAEVDHREEGEAGEGVQKVDLVDSCEILSRH